MFAFILSILVRFLSTKQLQFFLLDLAEKLARSTASTIDDQLVALIRQQLQAHHVRKEIQEATSIGQGGGQSEKED